MAKPPVTPKLTIAGVEYAYPTVAGSGTLTRGTNGQITFETPGSTPTGTGWRHVTGGVEDAASSTPSYSDVGAEQSGAVSSHNGSSTVHGSATTVGGKSIPTAGFEPAGTGHTEATDHVSSHDGLVTVHASATTIGGKAIPSAGFEPASAAIQTHITGTGSPHTAAGVGAEASGAVATHAALATGVHGAGASTLATTANIATHAGVTSSVHGFDSSGNAPPQAHAATLVTSGTLDGDRLPAMSTTKRGGVPATGTPSGLYLKDDSTWGTPTAGAHALGGASHTSDTLANLNAKVSDADVVALAGQLGGTAASPDVRGLRESGGQLLTMGAVTDGQYLKRNGTTIDSGSPGGGAAPPWKGAIAAAWKDGDPHWVLDSMLHAPVHATPTNISITVARCAFFKLDTQLVVQKIRWFGVGATTGLYHVAVYNHATLARVAILDDFNTSAQAWGSGAFSCTLAAGTRYILAVSVDTIGTTAGVACHSGSTGRIGIIPTNWPGNLDIDAASPKIDSMGFCQFAVTSGVLPATLPTLVLQAAWTGGMPAFFLDNNNS